MTCGILYMAFSQKKVNSTLVFVFYNRKFRTCDVFTLNMMLMQNQTAESVTMNHQKDPPPRGVASPHLLAEDV